MELEKRIQVIAEELESCGPLLSPPTLINVGTQALAAYADERAAREAIAALDGQLFSLAFCDPELQRSVGAAAASFRPRTAEDMRHEGRGLPREAMQEAGVLLLKGFPKRWSGTEVAALLRSAMCGDSKVEVLESATEEGVARVRFKDRHAAEHAAGQLQDQKVAGGALSISLEDGAKGEDGLADGENLEGGASKTRRKQRTRKDRLDTITVHIDELDMPRRPEIDPVDTDREVWVDPLPDEGELTEWLSTFGEVDDVYRVPDPQAGMPGDKGYIKFKEHVAAKKCVEMGTGRWSESERALTSQASYAHGSGAAKSTYPDSVVARILGKGGEGITALRKACGAHRLSLRGKDLGDESISQRLHFVVEGTEEALGKAESELEGMLARIHQGIVERIAEGGRRLRRGKPYDLTGDTAAWRPPGGRARSWSPGHVHGRSRGGGSAAAPHWSWSWAPGWAPAAAPSWAPPAGAAAPLLARTAYFPWSSPPGDAPWSCPPPSEGPWSGPPPSAAGMVLPTSRPLPPPPMPPDLPPPATSVPPKDPREGLVAPLPRMRPEGSSGRDRSMEYKEANKEGLADFSEGVRPQSFFEGLPPQLTLRELELADAVMSFIRAWRKTHSNGESANFVHLGADPRVRQCKDAALPRTVALRAWVERRIADSVQVSRDDKGTTIVELTLDQMGCEGHFSRLDGIHAHAHRTQCPPIDEPDRALDPEKLRQRLAGRERDAASCLERDRSRDRGCEGRALSDTEREARGRHRSSVGNRPHRELEREAGHRKEQEQEVPERNRERFGDRTRERDYPPLGHEHQRLHRHRRHHRRCNVYNLGEERGYQTERLPLVPGDSDRLHEQDCERDCPRSKDHRRSHLHRQERDRDFGGREHEQHSQCERFPGARLTLRARTRDESRSPRPRKRRPREVF